MIMATVSLYHKKVESHSMRTFDYVDTGPIHDWLFENVGSYAKFRDMVNEEHPWHEEHKFGHIEYSFAREQDATLFALRWS